jgi:hypothetical protein
VIVNLVSRDNGVGLTTDMDLLEGILTAAGHDVARVDWRISRMRSCAVAIFIELFNQRLLRYADATVGIFNLEWFLPQWRSGLRHIDQIWAKSREAVNQFAAWGLPAIHTGFAARDFYDPEVSRGLRCLHVQGKSIYKGTPTVLEAWRRNPDLPPLTIVTQVPTSAPSGVRVVGRLPIDELRYEMNRAAIHVCPSINEGWGHYIVEGLSTGATVVTTDASPMNEHVRPDYGFLVPCDDRPIRGRTRRSYSVFVEHVVTADKLAAAVRDAAALSVDEREKREACARRYVLDGNAAFAARAVELVGRLA